MKKKFNSESIKKSQFVLQKISAERIDALPNTEGFTIKRSDKFEILALNSNNVTLKLISKVYVDPEAMFFICFEYKASFEFDHKIDKSFIDKNIDEILLPLGSEMSYTTSTLTKLLVDHYFIMPPIIAIDEA